MRFHIVVILISLLLFRAGLAVAAAVEIELIGASERMVEANGFHTMGFIITNNAGSEQNFNLTVESCVDAELVSAPEPMVLKPGESQRAAITFFISGGVKDRQEIPAGVAVTAAGVDQVVGGNAWAGRVDQRRFVFRNLPGYQGGEPRSHCGAPL